MIQPVWLDFVDFPTIRDLAVATRALLIEPGACIVRGFPLDDDARELLTLGRSLGEVSSADVTVPLNPWIHRVAALDEAVADPGGYRVISATNKRFHCHTDEFASPRPADAVVQLCVRQAACGGGATLLAFLPDVVAALSTTSMATLSTVGFPTPFGNVALMEFRGGSQVIRYNRDRLNQYELSALQLDAIAELDHLIDRSSTEFSMQPGDCAVLNNRTVLHGRTAFDAPSERLLLRMRVAEVLPVG